MSIKGTVNPKILTYRELCKCKVNYIGNCTDDGVSLIIGAEGLEEIASDIISSFDPAENRTLINVIPLIAEKDGNVYHIYRDEKGYLIKLMAYIATLNIMLKRFDLPTLPEIESNARVAFSKIEQVGEVAADEIVQKQKKEHFKQVSDLLLNRCKVMFNVYDLEEDAAEAAGIK